MAVTARSSFVTRSVDMSGLPHMAQQFSNRRGFLPITWGCNSHASNHLEFLLGMVHDWMWWFLHLHFHPCLWSAKTSRLPKSVFTVTIPTIPPPTRVPAYNGQMILKSWVRFISKQSKFVRRNPKYRWRKVKPCASKHPSAALGRCGACSLQRPVFLLCSKGEHSHRRYRPSTPINWQD